MFCLLVLSVILISSDLIVPPGGTGASYLSCPCYSVHWWIFLSSTHSYSHSNSPSVFPNCLVLLNSLLRVCSWRIKTVRILSLSYAHGETGHNLFLRVPGIRIWSMANLTDRDWTHRLLQIPSVGFVQKVQRRQQSCISVTPKPLEPAEAAARAHQRDFTSKSLLLSVLRKVTYSTSLKRSY